MPVRNEGEAGARDNRRSIGGHRGWVIAQFGSTHNAPSPAQRGGLGRGSIPLAPVPVATRTPAMRISHRSIRPVGRTITFQFDGSPLPALEGETIAAALSAAGIVAFRRAPSGAPRGLYCGMGACFDCVVTVDGRIGQRACMTQVADGMVVTGEPTLPLAPLGREPDHAQAEERACDVLVVGAGPAGLSA